MAFNSFLGVTILRVITKPFALFLNTPDCLSLPTGASKKYPEEYRRLF